MKKLCKRFLWILSIGCLFFTVGAFGMIKWEERKLQEGLDQVKSDYRKLDTTIACYGIDFCGVFMPPDTSRCSSARNHIPTFETDLTALKEYCQSHSTYMEGWSTLTTPIAYLESLPSDPFRSNQPYGFISWNCYGVPEDMPTVCFYSSPGPDQDIDLELWDLKDYCEEHFSKKSFGTDRIEDRATVLDIILPNLYDPTNGSTSSGDLIRLNVFNSSDRFGSFLLDEEWLKASHYSIDEYRESEMKYREEQYYEGYPIEEPVFYPIKVQRNTPCLLPSMMVEAFQTVGVDLRGDYTKENSLFWRAGAGRLGRDFGHVIKSSHLWSSDQQQAYLNWIEEEQVYWNFIDELVEGCSKGEGVKSEIDIRSESYYIVMPIVGKSLYIQGMQMSSTGDLSRAREICDTLSFLVEHLGEENSRIDPHQHQIQTELWRITRMFEEHLDHLENQ